MKIKISISLFFFIILIIVSNDFINPALTNASGAPTGKTGSPGDGSNCTSCHSGPAASTQTGWITSNIPSGGYAPGTTYTITATVTRSGHSKFGFEISPQNLSGSLQGTLIITDATNTKLIGSGKYITHKSSGTTGTSGFHTWTFDWTAPISGTGSVVFYGAFNASNNSSSNSGDTIFLSTLQVQECNIAAPSITTSGNTIFCKGDSITLSSDASDIYLWNNGANTQNITVNSSGNYYVKITDSNGCSATSLTTTVTSNPPQNGLSISLNNDTLTSPYIQQNYWYMIGNSTPVDSGMVHFCSQVGSYYVVALDSNLCSSTSDTLFANCGITNISLLTTPQSFQLFPNPITENAIITYWMPKTTTISINLYDGLGNLVAIILDKKSQTGSNSVTIETSHLNSGIYFIEMTTDNISAYKKIILKPGR